MILENLAVAEGLINLSDKCFSSFQRHHREAQHIAGSGNRFKNVVPTSKPKVFSLLETRVYLRGKYGGIMPRTVRCMISRHGR